MCVTFIDLNVRLLYHRLILKNKKVNVPGGVWAWKTCCTQDTCTVGPPCAAGGACWGSVWAQSSCHTRDRYAVAPQSVSAGASTGDASSRTSCRTPRMCGAASLQPPALLPATYPGSWITAAAAATDTFPQSACWYCQSCWVRAYKIITLYYRISHMKNI